MILHHRSGLSPSTVQICFASALLMRAVAAGTSPSEYAVSSLFGLASENATAGTTPADGRYTRRDLLLVIPSCEERCAAALLRLLTSSLCADVKLSACRRPDLAVLSVCCSNR